jgi:hypothetical protein
MSNTTQKIMAELQEPMSRYSGLILHQLDSVYPKDEKRDLVRRAVLAALGQRGLLIEIHNILRCHELELTEGGSHVAR